METKEKRDELLDNFTKELFKMEPINFIGLAKLMSVPIANEDGDELRKMEEIVAEILNEFDRLSNGKKKEILKICKQANKNLKKGDKDGNRTKKRKHKSE